VRNGPPSHKENFSWVAIGMAPPKQSKSKQEPTTEREKLNMMKKTIATLLIGACSIGLGYAGPPASPPRPTPTPALAAPSVTCFSDTSSSITVKVTAGASGAPAGFSLQWMTAAELQALGGVWPASDSGFCKASFSGVPGCSQYNLGPNAFVTVRIGDNLFDECGASSPCTGPLLCNTEYVFRAFAHNVPGGAKRSPFSGNTFCSTDVCEPNPCPIGCTFTQGYWRTHGPEGCVQGNNTNEWPVTSLTLGNVVYTDAQLCSIFQQPAAGNGLLILAHQLIAAKLNIANGADPSAIQATINAADAAIGNLVVPPVGSGFLQPNAVDTLVNALDEYNQGVTGPGHCGDEENSG
jgi:hypothetical protein